MIREAIDTAFASGELLPYELGGTSGLSEIDDAVTASLGDAPRFGAAAFDVSPG